MPFRPKTPGRHVASSLNAASNVCASSLSELNPGVVLHSLAHLYLHIMSRDRRSLCERQRYFVHCARIRLIARHGLRALSSGTLRFARYLEHRFEQRFRGEDHLFSSLDEPSLSDNSVCIDQKEGSLSDAELCVRG